MAKWNYGMAGSSCHIHQSLWSKDGRSPLFFDKAGDHAMSAMMKQYLAGELEHAREITYFLAPYINSYKRFMAGTFAPTRAVWSFDNRTAGYRVCGAGTKAVRLECRIGGADLNPYLAFAALIAAGLDGVEKRMKLEPTFSGDAYDPSKKLREVPKTLREAAALLDGSKFLRAAMGDDVIDHYVHTAEWEQFEFDRRITDLELKRGFERY
jgi:glutamine synthetase